MKWLGLFLFLNSLALNATELALTSDQVDEPEVFQREYILTDFNSHASVQTYGVNTCVAVVLYDAQLKRGLLAHIDAQTDVNGEIKKLGQNFDWRKIKVAVVGGVAGERLNLASSIIKRIKSLGGRVHLQLQNKSMRESFNLRLNLNTGEISTYHETYSTTPPEIAAIKTERLRSGKRLYRHAASLGGGEL